MDVVRSRHLLLVWVFGGLIWSTSTLAHEIYADLKSKNGTPCCSRAHCRPAHFMNTPQGVKMFVEGAWLLVADELVQHRALAGDTGETRGGHWCGLSDWSNDGPGHTPYPLRVTYCAILPPGPAVASAAADKH